MRKRSISWKGSPQAPFSPASLGPGKVPLKSPRGQKKPEEEVALFTVPLRGFHQNDLPSTFLKFKGQDRAAHGKGGGF